MNVQDIAQELTIQVWDEDTLANDLIAETKLPLANLCVEGQVDDWIELQWKEKPSGKIHIVSTF